MSQAARGEVFNRTLHPAGCRSCVSYSVRLAGMGITVAQKSGTGYKHKMHAH